MLELLEKNAIERLDGAEHLLEQGLYTSSYESSFFAVEIILKAYVAKKHPSLGECKLRSEAKHLGPEISGSLRDAYFKHNLYDILIEVPEVQQRFEESQLSEAVQGLLNQFAGDGGFWEPWHRYVGRIDEMTARKAYNFAEIFQKWMLTTLLRP